jgi:hypothetical protein
LGVAAKAAAPLRASLRSVLRTLRPSRQLTHFFPKKKIWRFKKYDLPLQ